MPDEPSRAWYREPWPWILISGPAAVVVAGGVTLWLALATPDSLVADDYYRQGLAINRVLDKERNAERLGIGLRLEPSAGLLRAELRGAAPRPAALFVQLAHGTRADSDLRLRLAPRAAGVFEAMLPQLPAGRWRVAVEDAQGTWRVSGAWSGTLRPFLLGEAGEAAQARTGEDKR